jgi:hypothetical protein
MEKLQQLRSEPGSDHLIPPMHDIAEISDKWLQHFYVTVDDLINPTFLWKTNIKVCAD